MYHRRLLQQQQQQLQNDAVVKQSGNDVSPSLLITVLILAIAVILSASLYLLLRFLRRNTSTTAAATSSPTTRSLSSTSAIPRHVSRRVSPLVDALPLFTSDSLKSTGGGDCAVCLSKFEKNDFLRLLPICCHVFHADCIDTWLNSSQSCPLCRSPVFLPESELLSKLNNLNNSNNDVTSSSPPSLSSSSRSFRVEIGSVSRRNNNNNNNNNSGEFPVHRSYSLGGNFDYVVQDDVVSEVHSGSFRRTTSSNNTTSEFKLDSDIYPQQQLASEVGTRGGGGWLKDYLAHSLSNSLSSSFRSSGRWFFTGSSRRETTPPTMASELEMSEMDMEASRLGDEIGELFRWLSGV